MISRTQPSSTPFNISVIFPNLTPLHYLLTPIFSITYYCYIVTRNSGDVNVLLKKKTLEIKSSSLYQTLILYFSAKKSVFGAQAFMQQPKPGRNTIASPCPYVS